MAVSRDMRNYDIAAGTCYNILLALLPMLHVRVEPLTSAKLVIDSQDSERGELQLKAEPVLVPTTLPRTGISPYYRYKINVEPLGNDRCLVKTEASTAGVTDVGLGQLTLRQFLTTINLVLGGRLPPGTIPTFFIEVIPPVQGTPQAMFFERVHRGFGFAKKGLGDEAITEWSQALAINPNSVEVFYHKGVLLLLLENLEEARDNFLAALRLDTNHLLAKPYLDDTLLKIQQRRVKVSSTMATRPFEGVPHIEDAALSGKVFPTPQPGQTAGSGEAPGGGRSHVNEESLPTQLIKKVLNPRLLLKGEGIPASEFEVKRATVTLGRQEGNDIILLDGKVSRRHAELITIAGTTVLIDLGSANGTFLNGRRVGSNDHNPLQHGDKITLGDVEIVFTIPAAPTGHDLPTMKGMQTSPVNAEERAWALDLLGLEPDSVPTPEQIEAQYQILEHYWQNRINEAPTLKLRTEAENGLAELTKAREFLRW